MLSTPVRDVLASAAPAAAPDGVRLSELERQELQAWCRRLLDGPKPTVAEYALRAVERCAPRPGAMLMTSVAFGILTVLVLHALLTPSVEAVGRSPERLPVAPGIQLAAFPIQLPMVLLPEIAPAPDADSPEEPAAKPAPRKARAARSSPPGMSRSAARRSLAQAPAEAGTERPGTPVPPAQRVPGPTE